MKPTMMMPPRLHKFALTAHVTSSVGWFGTVAAFLTLEIAALRSQDAYVVRGFYSAMALIGWYVIVPFCLASSYRSALTGVCSGTTGLR